MKDTNAVLPEFDFRSGFIACTKISHDGHPGKTHSKFIKEFSDSEPNPDGSQNIVIPENTLRNWLYRDRTYPENFIPRWDIVFKLCRHTNHSITELLGLHREENVWASLINLPPFAIELLETYTNTRMTPYSELDKYLPRHGALVNYVLWDSFLKETIIPIMQEYSNQLERLSEISDQFHYRHYAVYSVISELYKNKLLYSIQPGLIDFVRRYALKLQNDKELTYYDTTPICITERIVDPNVAFKIGLNLALYHKQNPEDVRYGANAILEKKQELPPVNIQKFHRELNEHINNNGKIKKQVIEILDLKCAIPDPFEFIAYSSVHGWMSGEFIPKPLFLRVLCSFFSCDIDYLFGGQRYPELVYDKIDNETGLSKVFCKWLRDLPLLEHYCIEYLSVNRGFHSFISDMQNCYHFAQRKYLSDRISGRMPKKILLRGAPSFGNRLARLADHGLPIPHEILELTTDGYKAMSTCSANTVNIKNHYESDGFIYDGDEDTLITEYALSMLPKRFTEFFSDVLNRVEEAYLPITNTQNDEDRTDDAHRSITDTQDDKTRIEEVYLPVTDMQDYEEGNCNFYNKMITDILNFAQFNVKPDEIVEVDDSDLDRLYFTLANGDRSFFLRLSDINSAGIEYTLFRETDLNITDVILSGFYPCDLSASFTGES